MRHGIAQLLGRYGVQLQLMTAQQDEGAHQLRHLLQTFGVVEHGIVHFQRQRTAVHHARQRRTRHGGQHRQRTCIAQGERGREVGRKRLIGIAAVIGAAQRIGMPQIIHRRARARAEDAVSFVLQRRNGVGKGIEQVIGKRFTFLIAAQLGGFFAQGILQLRCICVALGNRLGKRFRGKGLCFVDVFFHGRQLVHGGGKAGAVHGVVVILCAKGDILTQLYVLLHQHALIGRRFHKQVLHALCDGRGFQRDGFPDPVKERFKAVAGGKVLIQRLFDHTRKRHSADIGNIHAHAGDDELPARGNDVVSGIRQIVAHLHQRRDDHIVIGILREAQPLTGELGTLDIQLHGRIFVHAQVDLGVDAAVDKACFQAQVGQVVDGAVAVLVAAAQHQALPVIALLHADVQVAVAVKGEEEILQHLLRSFPGQAAFGDILFVVGQHILVKATHGIVINIAGPQAEVQRAEGLQRGEEVLCAIAHGIGELCIRIAVGIGDDRIDDGEHGAQEFRIANARGEVFLRLLTSFHKTCAQHALIIAGDVAHASLFVDILACGKRFLFALGV